jgi:hypothetical protein
MAYGDKEQDTSSQEKNLVMAFLGGEKQQALVCIDMKASGFWTA